MPYEESRYRSNQPRDGYEYRDSAPEQYYDDRGGQYGEGGNYGSRSPDYRDQDYNRQFDERGYGRSDPFYGNRSDARDQSYSRNESDDVMDTRAYPQGMSGSRGYGSNVNYGPREQGYDEDYARGTGYRSEGYRRNSSFNRRDDYDRTRDRAFRDRDYDMRGYGDRDRNRNRGYDRDDRGFFDKAGDEIASWFGDDEAERRRMRDQRGRGPANYQRSNERLLEDACERLTHDSHVDARQINVTAENNEITLDGTVTSRSQKRAAEDCVHGISGVKHVQNNLRIADRDEYANDTTSNTRTKTKKT